MKVLTQLTASGGIDVASTGVDTIKLGTSNTENNDASVDNLTVWANADFKNNVTLGSSVADNTLVNSKLTASNSLYVSGNLYVNGVDITISSGGSGGGGGLSAQDVSGALTIYARSSDVSSSFVDNSELTSAITNFATRAEVTGSTNTTLSTVSSLYATKAGVTGALVPYATLSGVTSSFVTPTQVTSALSPYATLTGVSGTFVSNTSATSSLARLAAVNTFTANQIISGTLSLNNNINIISTSLGVKHSDTGENIFFGSASAASITNGYRNISFGYRSLNKNTTGYQNIAIGGDSLFSNSSGADNMVLGIGALYKNSSGAYNIAIGNSSLYNNTAGSNISIGFASQETKIGGSNTVAIGYETLRYATTSTNNTIIGNSSLSSVGLIDSTRNTVLGYNAGNSLISLRDSVIIGSNNGSTINGTTGSIIISDGAGNIRIQADSTGLVTVPGNLSVNGNTILGNASGDIITTSGSLSVLNNIKFPAVQVASADANTLDDYEEGSWTPAFSGSTATNFSYASRNAKYTKIGNRVYINGIISLSSTGSSAGTLTIGGLPFTSDTPLMSVFSGDMYNFSAGITGSINCGLGSTTSLVLYKYVGGNRTTVSVTELKNNSEYVFSGFYTA